jgi:hypothetical protein
MFSIIFFNHFFWTYLKSIQPTPDLSLPNPPSSATIVYISPCLTYAFIEAVLLGAERTFKAGTTTLT